MSGLKINKAVKIILICIATLLIGSYLIFMFKLITDLTVSENNTELIVFYPFIAVIASILLYIFSLVFYAKGKICKLNRDKAGTFEYKMKKIAVVPLNMAVDFKDDHPNAYSILCTIFYVVLFAVSAIILFALAVVFYLFLGILALILAITYAIKNKRKSISQMAENNEEK